jgi:hypothetical protein
MVDISSILGLLQVLFEMNGNPTFPRAIIFLGLIFALFTLPSSGSTIVVGRKYVVPAPDNLASLPDYVNMTTSCSVNTSSSGCIYAMNQFLSDLNLMIPDTTSQVQTLSDQISTDSGSSSYKQTLIQSLQATVNALSAQMIAATDTLDAGDSDYYNTLGALSANVSDLTNAQTSPILNAIATEKIAMLTRISALSQAVTNYLNGQGDVITSAANNIFQLFKNDQAIIQATADSQLATAVGQAANLTNQITAIRQGYATNYTTELSNLAAQQQKISSAKSTGDAQLQSAKDSIASAILSGINAALASARLNYQGQVTNISSIIDGMRNSSISTFDSQFAKIQQLQQNLSSQIDSNLTLLQSQANSLSNLISVRLQSAQSARDTAISTVNTNQRSSMASTIQAGQTLNSSLADYTAKTSSISSTIFGQSQDFMNQFANLATDAAASAGSSMVSAATSDGDAMSSLNGFIGDMSDKAFQTSHGTSATMGSSISSARDSVAQTGLKQIMALADAINTIDTLMSLLKAKMGLSSDQSGVQLSSIDDMLSYSVNAMQNTLGEVTAKVAADVSTIGTSAQKELSTIDSDSNKGLRSAQTQLNQIGLSLGRQINSVNIAVGDVQNAVSRLVSDSSGSFTRMNRTNNALAKSISDLRSRVSANWNRVTSSNTAFKSAVAASLSKLVTVSAKVSADQKTAANAYIQSQNTSFSNLINAAKSTALKSQNDAVSLLNMTAYNLTMDVNATSKDAMNVTRTAIGLANSAIATLTALKPLLESAGTSASSTAQKYGFSTISSLKSQIDTIRTQLMSSISKQTGSYYNSNMIPLIGVQNSINSLASQINSQIQIRDTLFPNGTSLFTLTPDAFKAQIESASQAVADASSVTQVQYGVLQSNLTSIYNDLSSQINQIDTWVSSLVPNVSALVNSAIASAQTNVTATEQSRLSYVDDLVASILAAADAQRKNESAITNETLVSFDSIIAQATTNSQSIMNQVTQVSDSEAAQQAAIADAMDQIIQSLMNVVGGNANALNDLKSQFSDLQRSTFGLSDRLSTSLSNAITAIGQASTDAQSKLNNQIKDASSLGVSAIADLGTRLAYAMDTLTSGSEDEQASLKNADSDAAKLAQAVASLGTSAQAQIRQVIAKIQSGQMTMDDVINAQSDLDINQLDSVEDIIAAFTQTMDSHVIQVKRLYQNETDELGAFNETIPEVISDYQGARGVTLMQTQKVIQEANTTALKFIQDTEGAIEYATESVQESQQDLLAMQQTVPVEIGKIRAAIKDAVESVERSQDALANDLITKATNAKSQVVDKIKSFRTTRNRNDYALTVDQVLVPVIPDELDLSQV